MEPTKQKAPQWNGIDRRETPTPFLSRYSFWGGRRHTNGPQSANTYVDVYSSKVWLALTLFLALNLMDSHFTLLYLSRGGQEGNPIAQALLNSGIQSFLWVKALGIGLAACLFCVLKNFQNGRLGIILALCLYQLLLVYHLALFLNLYPDSVKV